MAKQKKNSAQKKSSRKWYILIIIAVVIASVWLSVSVAVHWYINKTIKETRGVKGQAGDVDVNLFGGKTDISNIQMSFEGKDVSVPQLNIKNISVNFDYGALLRGVAAGKVTINNPQIQIVATQPPQNQTPQGRPVDKAIYKNKKVAVDFVRIVDGDIVLRDESKKVPLKISIANLDATIKNLANSKKLSEEMFASVNATASVMGSGLMKIDGKVNPLAQKPTFDIDATVENLDLTTLNEYIEKVSQFLFEKGELIISTELTAGDGFVNGFVLSTYKKVKVVDTDNNDITGQIKKKLGGIVSEFTGDEKKEFSTRVPVSMELKGESSDLWAVVANSLWLAFDKALKPWIEPS